MPVFKSFYIVDAFTSTLFGGNPAGVVLLNGYEFPEKELMIKIAQELRYSETAFVVQHSPKEFSIRFFTPRFEVNVCGHATIAAFYILYFLKIAYGFCVCHTLAGNLTVECGDTVMVRMVTPRIETDNEADDELIYNSLGLNIKRTKLAVKMVSTGLRDIIVPILDVCTLNNLRPNMDTVTSILERHKAVSIHAFALSNDNYTAHVRNFAPLYGIPEESATGTSNVSLTYYLQMEKIISDQGDFSFIQGETIGRPSVIRTRIASDGVLYLGGSAVIVSEGKLFI